MNDSSGNLIKTASREEIVKDLMAWEPNHVVALAAELIYGHYSERWEELRDTIAEEIKTSSGSSAGSSSSAGLRK